MSSLRQAPRKIVIECARCGRHGEYSRDRALRRYGDIGEQDFLFRVVSYECAMMRHPKRHACAAHIVRGRAAA
jgi:hypothetical protein